jgi:hypothetical protein
MTAPPEPVRSKFLELLAKNHPWFVVGREVIHISTGRRMTIRLIDHEDWSFHTSEPRLEKWLKWRLYDVVLFSPAVSVLDKVERHFEGD